MSSKRLIIRESDGDLYDPKSCDYLLLEELEDVILKGTEILVIDELSLKDVTGVVLLEILLAYQYEVEGSKNKEYLVNVIKSKQIANRIITADGVSLSEPVTIYYNPGTVLSHIKEIIKEFDSGILELATIFYLADYLKPKTVKESTCKILSFPEIKTSQTKINENNCEVIQFGDLSDRRKRRDEIIARKSS